MSTEQPDAGPSANGGTAPGPSKAQGTLAAMWGKPAPAPAPASAAPEPGAPTAPTWAAVTDAALPQATLSTPAAAPAMAKTGSNASTASQPRKRKKKETGPPQGKLVFGAHGVGYGAPSPPPAPEADDKKKGKAKGKRKPDSNGEEGSKKRRGKANGAGSAGRSLLSPDTASEAAGLSDSEIEVLGEGRHKGSGHQDDPVRIDESPKLPKRIVFAADQKTTTHSFFAKPAPAKLPAEEDVTPSGAVTPTAAGNGAAGPGLAAPKKQVHSFFAMAGKGEPGQTKKGWGCCREGDEPRAFLPFGEWASHVGSRFDGGATWSPQQAATPHVDDDGAFWKHYLSDEAGPSRLPPRAAAEAVSAPPFILDHPAIAAVGRTPKDAQQSWCDLHRPREAAAVLGNEVEAVYLRDWLKALSVGGIDSKRVIRKVHRRKAVNPELSWIVDDAGLFGDPLGDTMYEDDEIPEPVEEPLLPLGARPDVYPIIGNWVSNTILLAGPSGTGKSAAVHAAAAELGWEVFEVYPGIGRRTGTNLLSLVGDVGKNHTVTREKKADKKATAADALKAMFGKAKAAPPPKASQGSAADPIELDDEARDPDVEVVAPPVQLSEPAQVVATPETPAESKSQQSLILIDEADILFEEESSFWPALVSLIAESRRPVVITCNGELNFVLQELTADIGRIPLQTLPLQTILHFKPAASHLAHPYLAAIARHHGVKSPTMLRQQPYHPDLVDQPLPPNGNEPAEVFDLRAAITQLQLDRGAAEDERNHGVGDLASLALRLENMSFADAFVAKRDWGRLEVDRYTPSGDDEEAKGQLLKPFTQDAHPVLAVCDASDLIADTLVALAGGAVPHENVQYAQTAYIRRVLPLLDELVFLSGRLLPHPSLFLETVPFTRTVVRADDLLVLEDSQASNEGAPRINRRTGRLMRTGRYERWLDLPEDLLDIARYGGLDDA